MASFIRQKKLTIAQQGAVLRGEWPSLKVVTRRNELEASGVVQPSAISGVYTVSIEYCLGSAPYVYVHSPALSRRREQPDEPVPHVYPWREGTEGRPCLYRPWSNEWHPGKHLSRTIVPWLLTWLANYEVWRATGRWLGGGAPHQRPKTDYA